MDIRKRHLSMSLPHGFIQEHATTVPLGEDQAGHPVFCWPMAEQERVLTSFDDWFLLRTRLKDAALNLGISPAQLNLCELVASGDDLSSTAERLGASVGTVRTQLQRILEKSGTHSQSAMISLRLCVHGPNRNIRQTITAIQPPLSLAASFR